MILDAGGGELRPDVAHKRAQERQNEGSHTRRGGGTTHHPASEGPPQQGRAALERAGKGSVRGAGGPSLCPGSAHIGRRKPIGRRLVCEGPGGRARWAVLASRREGTSRRARARAPPETE